MQWLSLHQLPNLLSGKRTVIDMSDPEDIGPPKEAAKTAPKPANREKRKKERKEAKVEKELDRREQIIENMRENGFHMTDDAVIDFMDGYMQALDLYDQRTGRPSKYFPEAGAWAVYFGHRGLSIRQIASIFGVSYETLYQWARENDQFSDALTRAREAAQSWWETVGQAALFADRFQFGLWNKVVSSRFRRDYTDRKGLPYNPSEPETLVETGDVVQLDPRDLTEEQRKVLRIAIAKAEEKEKSD